MAQKVQFAKPSIGVGLRGQYRVATVTGTLAAALAVNAQVFQFKFPAAAVGLAAVTRIRARFLPLTPFTAATLTDHTSFDAFTARSYSGGGSGTTVTLSNNNAKMATAMATCQAAINIATTGALTNAATLDANPFASMLRKANRVNPAAATEEVVMASNPDLEFLPLFAEGDIPLILAPGEGFVLANRTVWPAAGTGILSVEVGWTEAAGF